MKMYKLHESIAKIKLTEKAVKKLILNENFDGNETVYYDIEFSEEELKSLKNCVLYKKESGMYVVPVGIDIGRKEIDIKYVNSMYKSLKNLIKSGVKYKGSRIFRWILVWTNDKYVSSLYVHNYMVRYVNMYVIENGKLPSKEMFKNELIRYLNSYDVLGELEMIINKEKLKLLA
ncbi:MAG: hypothetical protein QW795_06560 [Candidatus Bathyarchaeia archaeon]